MGARSIDPVVDVAWEKRGIIHLLVVCAKCGVLSHLLNPSRLRVYPFGAPLQDEIDGVVIPFQVALQNGTATGTN